MTKDKPKIIAILGPTAVGKSNLGIEIAKKIGGEIINADSLQVYKYLDIGTAKTSKKERNEVPHHLIDIVFPDEDFNAGTYRKLAGQTIKELHEKSAKIILVGGTYLYVRVLLYGLVEGVSADKEIREDIRKLKSAFGTSYLYEELKSLDPDSASRIRANDYVRIERALEAYYLTGERMSELQAEHGFREDEYEVLKIGLFEEREVLRRKINERVDRMVESGLVDEVKKLREMGYNKDLKPMQSIGYKQVNQYLDGEITLDRAIELIKRDTKRFAKRQMTWLRSDKDIRWFHLPEDFDKIISIVTTFFIE
ncbi:MAG TPA: tRNA (adenosine(37)-N6)-dimethylallyltransferase MiaA [Thermodesulfobacteriota bacterium]|nr:tRNA (adenosine(37)-N6)-dimethylallyltransferase MiaA [Thermodesulfobacteriota bacterium]